MKYNRALFISIPLGILLSGCSTGKKETPPPTTGQSAGKNALVVANSTQITKPLPNYVKHNPGSGIAAGSAKLSAIKATITVQLECTNGGDPAYIKYIIKDKYTGASGIWHSKMTGSQNESNSSGIFTTAFPCNSTLDVRSTSDGEVTIADTTADKKYYKWKSDSSHHADADQNDSDVRWICVNCP